MTHQRKDSPKKATKPLWAFAPGEAYAGINLTGEKQFDRAPMVVTNSTTWVYLGSIATRCMAVVNTINGQLLWVPEHEEREPYTGKIVEE